MHVLPLAQSHERQKILLAPFAKFRLRELLASTGAPYQFERFAFHGGLDLGDRIEILQRVRDGRQRVIFTSPESLFGVLGAAIVEAARGDRASLASAMLLAALALAWCVGLAAAAVGLLRERRRARAPVVVSEILLLSIGIPLAQSDQTDQKWLGVLVIASAAIAISACLTRSVTGRLTES